MARVTAPLLSFGGTGQIGKSMVFGTWKGVPYARRYVIPANPRTIAQQRNRNIFATLREMWKLAPDTLRAPWNSFVEGRPLTGVNKFIGENRLAVGAETDFDQFLGSPGAKGGLPAASVGAATGTGAGEVDVTFGVPDVPTGWTLVGYRAAGFQDQDPSARFDQSFAVGSVAAPTATITLTGLPAGQLCVIAGWTEWTKPDGVTAFGPSLGATATSGA